MATVLLLTLGTAVGLFVVAVLVVEGIDPRP